MTGADANPLSAALDLPTLFFVATAIASLLGLFMVFAWLQERSMRALAWWGSAYLIGGGAIVFWSAPAPALAVPPEIPGALIFVACGMVWNGVRLFHGRGLRPIGTLAGAVAWLLLCQIPPFDTESSARILLAAGIVSAYTFFIAAELRTERRRSLHSRIATVAVPALHAAIFIMPIAVKAWNPATDVEVGSTWFALFALQTIIYAIGTAFIMLTLVKDYHVHIHKTAASTDPLTGLVNRRAFLDGARSLCRVLARQGRPVTVLMFDLDRFKAINDTYGHPAGDEVIRLFARTACDKMRTNDVIGRLGGEEFAAIVPGSADVAEKIAERIRAGFEAASVEFGGQRIATTVSIGAACTSDARGDVDRLIAHADAALYRAKAGGRNRLCLDSTDPATDPASRAIVAVRNAAGLHVVQNEPREHRPAA